jgi:formate dehydrogenase iron-sulfur subunit
MKAAESGPMGILFDATYCVGCQACVAACMEQQGFEGDPELVHELSATACTAIVERGGDQYERRLCRHCVNPTCVSVCPVGALRQTDLGPVTYDASRCLGCRYCMLACPYDVPKYEWLDTTPVVRKCDMCHDLLARGETTACADACYTGATMAGRRDELLVEARARIADDPKAYDPHICGAEEIGGTCVLVLLPAELGHEVCKASLGDGPLPDLTWEVLRQIPPRVAFGTCALAALAWIVRRRNAVRASAQKGTVCHA